MKFSIQREHLVSIIGIIQGVVPTKPVIPILSNVLVQTQKDLVRFTVNDLTVSIFAEVEAGVEETGSVTLPAKRFFQLVRELTAPEIMIQSDPEGLTHIMAGTSHFRIHGMDHKEFPAFPEIDRSLSFSVDSAFIKDMLTNTSFAAARDDSRKVLNSIFMQIENGKIIFVGTDGKKLAKIEREVPFETKNTSSSIIPLKAVEEMSRLLDEEDKVQMTIMEDKIALETSHLCLVTKLLSGEFPDYQRVIPVEENTYKISIHREELLTLLKQVSLFTSHVAQSVKLTFHKGILALQTANSQLGEGKVYMPVDYEQNLFEIAFHPQNFIDVLRHCKDDIIRLDVTDSFNPGSIKDSADTHFVLMPMRFHTES